MQKQDLLEVLEEAEKEENKEGAAKEAANSAKLPEAEENFWMQGLSEALGCRRKQRGLQEKSRARRDR